ncbi:MAG TPA: S41 family peptidase [Gaiellaceae bacterium]
MRRAVIFLALGLLLAGAFGLGFALSDGRGTPSAAAPRTPSIVEAVRNDLAARYYRALPANVLAQRSIRSMIAALDDPYTEYLSGPAFRLLRRETAGRYSGIGITLLPSPGGLLVAATEPGPGRRAGIRAGDTIVRIGAVRTEKMGLESALGRLSGPEGTVVRLRVQRAGQPFDFTVRRAIVRSPTVSSKLIRIGADRYGYVAVSAFRSDTAADLARAVRRLRSTRPAGMVLDLRGNPGGLLDQAVAVTSLFLSRGRVVTLEGAHRPREVYQVSGHPVAPRLPLVVLVDRYTASSAEVVAAALHDNGRAILVGEHTYGKAVVQSIDPLANGGALALTTARYFTPAGADISRKGVRPDVHAVEPPGSRTDAALAAALTALAAARS